MSRHFAVGLGVVMLAILISGSHAGYVFAQPPPPPTPYPDQHEVLVLTRGPVHEAFAEPVSLEIQAGLSVSSPPPPNINEMPPAYRPHGDYTWVPGYWAWDADRNDFIWISAAWRLSPPGMYWVPGYWAQLVELQDTGRRGVNVVFGGLSIRVGGRPQLVEVVRWHWVSGFWASADTEEIEYLPTPPAPIDLVPPGPPPTADSIWVPGTWNWLNGRYVPRSGYWLRQHPDWVWVPTHYRWTPRGYVFQAGYWDYPLEQRGLLFAPVYIPRPIYLRPGYIYTPTIAIDLTVLSANLFIYPLWPLLFR